MAKRSDWLNAIKVLPALLISLILLVAACHPGSGLTTDSSGGGGSGSPTPTPTPLPGGSFAYSTNFGDAMVSEFSRNTTTGVLTFLGVVTAGAVSGPKGIAITPGNSFLYVANFADGKIYEFSINGSTGKLTSIGSVDNGSKSGPQFIAISPNGSFLWVTGGGDGSVTSYKIAANGKLTAIKNPLVGFSAPLGIVVDPGGTFLFVSDPGNGNIYPLTINADGTLTQTSPQVQSAQAGAVTPGLLADDSTNPIPTLWVTDYVAGIVSPFAIGAGGVLTAGPATGDPGGPTVKPFGIGVAPLATEYLFTANQKEGAAQAYSIFGQTLTGTATVTSLDAPTQLVVDSQNAFVYTTDQTGGVITQMQINGVCHVIPSLCFVASVATESPASLASAPFGIALTH
ncbi:MAG TPA: beta-propeller fold lactonase family protein [Candidatus Binataceae bacterium]